MPARDRVARLRASWRAVALGVASITCAWDAAAEPGAWLHWDPPPECPTKAEVEARVVELLGGPLPALGELAVGTRLQWQDASWRLQVDVAYDGHSNTREVSVDRCTQAAEFVAVAVVLALDPARIPADGSDATRSPVPGPNERPEAIPAPQSTTGSEAPPRRRVTQQREAAPPPQQQRCDAEPTAHLRPHLAVSSEGTIGVLPDPSLGVAASAGVELGRLSLALGGSWYPSTTTKPQRAQEPIAFSLFAGRVNAVYWMADSGVRLGPSASVYVGAIGSQQQGATRAQVQQPWVAFGAGATLLAGLTDSLSLLAELELVSPFTQPAFLLSDGSEVHRVVLGPRASLGLRVAFGE